MRKLKLRQPYASMVISGALETIPDIWGNVKYGEKIFIYSDDLAEDFKDGLDFHKKVHRKVFNEMFLGNIPDEEYVSGVFLGYVSVYHTGRLTKYWSESIDCLLFIKDPHEFDFLTEDYGTNFHDLEDISSHPVKHREITRNRHILTVPVGEYTWNQLRNKDRYKDAYLFWEQYMEKLLPTLFSEEFDNEEPIQLVKFKYKAQVITFYTNCNTGWVIQTNLFENSIVDGYVLNFDLCQLSQDSEVGFVEQETSFEPKRQWIHVISTPMGGMTKWKRK